MEENDYMDLVNNQIEIDKLMHSVKPENRETARKLLEKKKEIMRKNGFFADFQLRRINRKLDKLKGQIVK